MNARMNPQPFTLRNVFNCLAVEPEQVSFGDYLELHHVTGGTLISPEMRLSIERKGNRLHLSGITGGKRMLTAALDPRPLDPGGPAYWWSGDFTSSGVDRPRVGQLYLIVRKLDPTHKKHVRIARIELFEKDSGHVPPHAGCVLKNRHLGQDPSSRGGPKPPPSPPCPPAASIASDQDEEGEGYDAHEP
jgi:hypothetical protein